MPQIDKANVAEGNVAEPKTYNFATEDEPTRISLQVSGRNETLEITEFPFTTYDGMVQLALEQCSLLTDGEPAQGAAAEEIETFRKQAVTGADSVNASPAAVEKALDHEVNLRGVEGSGNDGKIVVEDVDQYIAGLEEEEDSVDEPDQANYTQ